MKISFNSREDLEKLPPENKVMFMDGPMKGYLAGIVSDSLRLNLCYGPKEQNPEPQTDLCEHIGVKVKTKDSSLVEVLPFPVLKVEKGHTILRYSLVDSHYYLSSKYTS